MIREEAQAAAAGVGVQFRVVEDGSHQVGFGV